MALTGPIVVGPDAHGRSVAIVEGRVVVAAPKGAAHLACADGEIEPGAICAHTHLYSGLARYGMPPPDRPPANFLEILQKVWWRLDRALDSESLAAAARDTVARALLAGTTTLVDHHESPNLIEGSLAILAEACEALGVRALVCYGASERNFGREEAQRGLAECRRVAASPLIRGLVGLHASFTISDQTARETGALARELGTIVHVHLAEDQADVDDARRRGYPGPLERLLSLDALPPGSILAHGVRLSPARCASPPTPVAGSSITRAPTRAIASVTPARCPPRSELPWVRMVGTPTWPRKMRRSDASPSKTATRGSAVDLRGATRWRRSVSARKPSRWRQGRSAIWSCGEMALCATWSSAAASWSRTGSWRRLTMGRLRPGRTPKRRACGRAWRRSEASADGRNQAPAGLAPGWPAVAGTQVLGTGQTEAQCGESWKPLHSVHFVGSIT